MFGTMFVELKAKGRSRPRPTVCLEAHYKEVPFTLAAPLLEQEGRTRPKEKCCEASFDGADGVVAHTNSAGMLSERLSVSDHPGASRHPSCTRRGTRARTVFRNLDSRLCVS